MKRMEGKVAVITGAASGMGLATAQMFVAEGAQVVAVDRPESDINTAFQGHANIVPLAKSITDEDAPAVMLKTVLDHFGGVDILFNNAGVGGRFLAEETTDEEWRRQMDVNVTAPFRTSRAFIPALRERAQQRGRARIINTASVMAFDTDIGLAAYTASKHAVAGLTKNLALELGKYRITANYLMPGAVLTGMTRTDFNNPEIVAVWAKKAALRRIGQPEDMARAVFLLASDESDFITGHGLVADGGLTLRT